MIPKIALVALASFFAQAQTQLFNGKDLDGWKAIGRQEGAEVMAGFGVHNGLLETTTGKGVLWYTKQKIGNAVIKVVYKMSNERGNSGVFIRIPVEPKNEDDAINKGIEVQIDNRDDDWHATGVLYSMTKAMARPYKAPGEWNTMEITLNGLRTIVKVNGVLVTDYDGVSPVPEKKKSFEPDRGPRPAEGYIAIQHHDEACIISFREISVSPLK
jgi:Domain of Unknown Function (DUF1080)